MSAGSIWTLVRRQHGVIAHWQLAAAGLSAHAIRHRLASGRLHRVYRGVYAVGRPELTRMGWWTAARLASGDGAVLSHGSAAMHLGIERERLGIEVSVPGERRRIRGVTIHARTPPLAAIVRDQIPLTDAFTTIVDVAPRLTRGELERMVGQADQLGLCTPELLRVGLEQHAGRPGVAVVRQALDRRIFRLTRSELERLFLPIARRAGLGTPETQTVVNGYEVDFFWQQLGLVVETDGLRYHRTLAQQTSDRVRDQTHTAAGLTPLRFTHAQIKFEPGYVGATLARVAARLAAR